MRPYCTLAVAASLASLGLAIYSGIAITRIVKQEAQRVFESKYVKCECQFLHFQYAYGAFGDKPYAYDGFATVRTVCPTTDITRDAFFDSQGTGGFVQLSSLNQTCFSEKGMTGTIQGGIIALSWNDVPVRGLKALFGLSLAFTVICSLLAWIFAASNMRRRENEEFEMVMNIDQTRKRSFV